MPKHPSVTTILDAANKKDFQAAKKILEVLSPEHKSNALAKNPEVLHIAIRNKDSDFACWLIEQFKESSLSLDEYDSAGWTPALLAAGMGLSQVLSVLINSGADYNKSSRDGAIPIIVAAQNGHLESVKKLVDANADVNKQDQYGKTAIELALHIEHFDVAMYLKNHGAKIEDLNQYSLIGMYRMLSSMNKNLKFPIELNKGGVCHGLAHLYLQFSQQDKAKEFFAFFKYVRDLNKKDFAEIFSERDSLEEKEVNINIDGEVRNYKHRVIREFVKDISTLYFTYKTPGYYTSRATIFENSAPMVCATADELSAMLQACISDEMENICLTMIFQNNTHSVAITRREDEFICYDPDSPKQPIVESLDNIAHKLFVHARGAALGVEFRHLVYKDEKEPSTQAYEKILNYLNMPIQEKALAGDINELNSNLEKIISRYRGEYISRMKMLSLIAATIENYQKQLPGTQGLPEVLSSILRETQDLTRNRITSTTLMEFAKKNYFNVPDVSWPDRCAIWLYMACWGGHADLIPALLGYGVDVNANLRLGMNPLVLAADFGYTEIVELLINAGADVNAQKDNGATAAFSAAQEGHVEVLRILIAKGANVDMPMHDGATPVCIASYKGNIEALKLLKAAKADINKAMQNGCTPLIAAAQNGHTEVVEFLLKNGATLDNVGAGGGTAVYCASQNGHVEPLRLLIEAGADFKKAADDGRTPLMIAQQNKHQGCISLLKTQIAFEERVPKYKQIVKSAGSSREKIIAIFEDYSKPQDGKMLPARLDHVNLTNDFVQYLKDQSDDISAAAIKARFSLITASKNMEATDELMLLWKYAEEEILDEKPKSIPRHARKPSH